MSAYFSTAPGCLRAVTGAAAEYLAGELMAALGTNRVDLLSLNDAPPLFARHIISQGVRVVSVDEAATHAFERDVMLRAADLQPFVERGRRRLLDALRP
jgi:hypothetical protein